MRFVIALTLLFSSLVHSTLETPRETFKTYLKAMVEVKKNVSDKDEYYKKAISTFEGNYHQDEAISYANHLIKVFDKLKKVDYKNIPESLNSNKWIFDKRSFKNKDVEISVVKVEGKWYFSKRTLSSVESYLENLKSDSYVTDVIIMRDISDEIRNKVPNNLKNKFFLLENWQWVGLFVIFLFSFIVEKLFTFFINFLFSHSQKWVKPANPEKLSMAINPMAKIVFIGVIMFSLPILDFPPQIVSIIKRALYISICVMTVWFGHKVIQFLSDYFATKASQTTTKFDDILIPLLTKTAFVVIYLLGALLVLNSLTIDVTGLIAGLGIGGLAFAFAAKDTLANFFGSVMLVLDRPFDIGDIIRAGDIEGIVTEVGFRSTRIRTFNDSLITISNGELMNRSIDNMGKRRFRRHVTALGLEYGTPAEKIEAFCEGIRQLILNHKWTRKDNFHVYFTGFGASSLDIKMIVYWKTEDYARELAEKHRLMIDILRLAKELEVEFAFPTQTLHVFNETRDEKAYNSEKYFEEGIEKAKTLTSRPLSLKNPRSNFDDKEQFGKNDIGLE